MSLARAFTTRRQKVFGGGGDSESKLSRNASVKGSASGPLRNKISGPVQLISTTNMLSYDAPDIHQKGLKSAASNSSSLRSEEDSDHIQPAAYSPPTSPDSTFPYDDQGFGKAPDVPNHLSNYFTLPGQSSAAPQSSVPAIPQRSPSHTKKNYDPLRRKPSVSRSSEPTVQESLARKPSISGFSEQSSRTVSTKASFSFSRSSSASTSTTASSQHSTGSLQMPKASTLPSPVPPTALSTSAGNQYHNEPASATDSMHPFGHELAQVTELAEEYSSAPAVQNRAGLSREELELFDSGLRKFTPEDYIAEVQALYTKFFGETRYAMPAAAQWI